ncbi:MAG: hypothetical protein ACHQ5A_14320, partial [Opitutales bacterium]
MRSQKLELALIRRHILRLREDDLFEETPDLEALEEADGRYRQVVSRLFPQRDPYEEFSDWCLRLGARERLIEEFFRTRTTVLRQIADGPTLDLSRLEAGGRELDQLRQEWEELLAQGQADLRILTAQKAGNWDELREFGVVGPRPDWADERNFARTREAVEVAGGRGDRYEHFSGLLRVAGEKIAAARADHAAQRQIEGQARELLARGE